MQERELMDVLNGGFPVSALHPLQMSVAEPTATATINLNQPVSPPNYTLLTGTAQSVMLEGLVIQMPNAAAGGALTSISIQTDDATPQVIITAVQGAVAHLTAMNQLSWTGKYIIGVGTKIQLTINGGANGVAYVCNVVAQFRPIVAGGYLA